MTDSGGYFLLYSGCIPVKGAKRAAIYDLERGKRIPVPNLLIDVLKLAREMPVGALKEHYDHEMNEGIDAFFQKLLQDQIGFYTLYPERFPPIAPQRPEPGIRNAIVEWDTESRYSLNGAAQKLLAAGCKALLFRFPGPIAKDTIDSLMDDLRNSPVQSVEIHIQAAESFDTATVRTWLRRYSRLVRLIVFHKESIPGPYVFNDPVLDGRFYLQNINLKEYPSRTQYLVPDPRVYAEALYYNAGLMGKLSIDREGIIHHYPGHSGSFGHIEHTSLSGLPEDENFIGPWLANHDQTVKCSQCENRYICVDFSELSLTTQPYLKLTDCGYSPLS